MPGIRRYWLRKDKIRELKARLPQVLAPLAERLGKQVEVWEIGERQLVWSGGEPLFIAGERVVPMLKAVGALKLPRVVVDMGAVGPVCRGADVMAPGVREADASIKAGDLVLVVDERHKKPLAVGEALVPGGQMRGKSGRVVKNLHHVGDEFWRASEGATP